MWLSRHGQAQPIPGVGAGSAGPRLRLCVLRAQLVLQRGQRHWEGPSFQILPDGNGDSTTRKAFPWGEASQLPETPLLEEPISHGGNFRGCSARGHRSPLHREGDRQHMPDQPRASPWGWSQGQALSSTQGLCSSNQPLCP